MNADLKLYTDRNEMTVTGVAGRTKISGYLVCDIDLGQGVKVRDVIYVVPEVLGGRKMLLSKPFLAIIDAHIGARHDYLSVPRADGPPIIIEGRRYMGNYQWKHKHFAPSNESIISETEVQAVREQYALIEAVASVTGITSKAEVSTYLVDKNGKKALGCDPLLSRTESLQRGMQALAKSLPDKADELIVVLERFKDMLSVDVTAGIVCLNAGVEDYDDMGVELRLDDVQPSVRDRPE